MGNIFNELRRRNVFRIAGIYAVVGWLLAQVSVTLETAIGLPPWFDGFVVALLLIGFPIALILAWAFEMTPEGMKLTAAVPEGESIAPVTAKKLDYVIIGGLALVAVMIIADRIMPHPEKTGTASASAVTAPEEVSAASIAVLPFADLSPAGDQEYFSDGISEEILNVLVGVKNLSVASRTSSFQFKGRDIGVPQIASELKVRHVLEGSIRKAGNTIRITAQLIDASNDRHLWSETYDEPLTAENIFAIQDKIANAIVAALSTKMGVSAAPAVSVTAPTDNIAAYDLYLQARRMFESRINLLEAEKLLARAVEQDPKFVKAWETRAAVYAVIGDYGGTGMPRKEEYRKALEFVEHVLTLDPESATAIAVRANIQLNQGSRREIAFDRAQNIAEFERALRIDPRNLAALNWVGFAYAEVGDVEHALERFTTCTKYEPYYTPCVENRVAMLGISGQDEAALAAYKQALNTGVLKPIYAPIPAMVRLNEETLVKTILNQPGLLFGYRRIDEYYKAFQSPGDYAELAADMLAFITTQTTLTGDETAIFLHPIGAYDLAPFPLVFWDAAYAKYRQSPQFKNYVRESGILNYWREHGFPPQCKPISTKDGSKDDFECE